MLQIKKSSVCDVIIDETREFEVNTEKCDVEHICFHSVRLIRDPSFGYPEHSNWQRGFGSVLISPALLTPPNKQTSKLRAIKEDGH
jgi:hypothetical protein